MKWNNPTFVIISLLHILSNEVAENMRESLIWLNIYIESWSAETINAISQIWRVAWNSCSARCVSIFFGLFIGFASGKTFAFACHFWFVAVSLNPFAYSFGELQLGNSIWSRWVRYICQSSCGQNLICSARSKIIALLHSICHLGVIIIHWRIWKCAPGQKENHFACDSCRIAMIRKLNGTTGIAMNTDWRNSIVASSFIRFLFFCHSHCSRLFSTYFLSLANDYENQSSAHIRTHTHTHSCTRSFIKSCT